MKLVKIKVASLPNLLVSIVEHPISCQPSRVFSAGDYFSLFTNFIFLQCLKIKIYQKPTILLLIHPPILEKLPLAKSSKHPKERMAKCGFLCLLTMSTYYG